MPISFDNTPTYTLHGLFRPALDFLDRLPFWSPAAVALVAAAVLVLERLRSRPPSPCIPGGSVSREGTLGHLRQVKTEMKGRRGEAAVAGVLARAGFPALHDVIVRDAWGLTQVDHLVRLADGIAVLETKAFAGTVTGHVGDRRWVQELRGGPVRTAFRNPVMQNERHVRAVRRVAGSGVPVCGLVVSAGAARFCGELEGAVVGLDGLPARLCAGPAVACDVRRLDAAWRALTAAAMRSGALRGAHLRQARRLAAARRPVAAGLLLPLLALLSCLASPGVKAGGVRPGGAGLRWCFGVRVCRASGGQHATWVRLWAAGEVGPEGIGAGCGQAGDGEAEGEVSEQVEHGPSPTGSAVEGYSGAGSMPSFRRCRR